MFPSVIILTKQNLPEGVPYYCMRCKTRMFDINRDIAVLFMGNDYPTRDIPKGMGFIKHKCRGCMHVYTFYFQQCYNAIKGMSRELRLLFYRGKRQINAQ